ncbi:hypothetical protein E2C01_039911 [Portunus trituberculatus]|uniref:Uncharacterized protein n=1 Tax=Portunus trituberculatus TaxID=210409 RepID=A0A5B7FLW9_PORTR|nr:hypothetical protein [Portunus trituberculatus]
MRLSVKRSKASQQHIGVKYREHRRRSLQRRSRCGTEGREQSVSGSVWRQSDRHVAKYSEIVYDQTGVEAAVGTPGRERREAAGASYQGRIKEEAARLWRMIRCDAIERNV